MRTLILLITGIISSAAFCQSEKSQRRLCAVGIMVSPDYSYRALDFSESNQWIAKIKNDEEIGNYGFTAGCQMHYRLSSRSKLETGLLYSNKTLETKYKDLSWTSDDPLLPERSKTVYHFKYLVLPAGINYSLLHTGKVRLFTTAGIVASVFISHKTKVVTLVNHVKNTEASSKQTGYSKFNVSGRLGLGIDCQLSKRFMTRAEPFYQRSLNSVVADRDARMYLFSFGVAAGVYYTLNL